MAEDKTPKGSSKGFLNVSDDDLERISNNYVARSFPLARESARVTSSSQDQDPLFEPRRQKSRDGKRDVKGTITKKYLSQIVEASSKEAAITAFDEISSALFPPNYDTYDSLDFYATHIVFLLREGIVEFSQLKHREQDIFFRYIARTNPIIGRIVDLHKDLPLSKIKLQPPKDVPEIVRDFVLDFFEKILSRINFEDVLRQGVAHYLIHGYVDFQIDDYFGDEDKILQPVSDITSSDSLSLSEEDEEFIEKIETDYSEDPLSVSLEDRLEYLKKKFPLGYSPSYKGPDGFSIVPFWRIYDRYLNEDIGYEAIEVLHTDSFKDLQNEGEDVLRTLGYSKGFLSLVKKDEESYMLENDFYQPHPWLMHIERTDGTSFLHRVWREALEWDAVKTAIRGKISQIGQVGRVVTSSDASEEQISEIRSEITAMLEDPTYAIVTNLDMEWQEIDTYVKEELGDVSDRIPDLTEEIATGLGFPDSLLTGDSPYNGDQIQLETLNTFYQSFSIQVLDNVVDKLIKPISIRKGLVMLDEWGDAKTVFPKLNFTRVGIRSEEVFDRLYDLFERGNLPLSIILDHFNIDIDDITRAYDASMFTSTDPFFQSMIEDIYGSLGSDVMEQTNIMDLVIENMPVKKVEPSEDDEDSGGGRGRGRF